MTTVSKKSFEDLAERFGCNSLGAFKDMFGIHPKTAADVWIKLNKFPEWAEPVYLLLALGFLTQKHEEFLEKVQSSELDIADWKEEALVDAIHAQLLSIVSEYSLSQLVSKTLYNLMLSHRCQWN